MREWSPLCIDLFCGLGGWTEGFLAEGYRVIGFDVERHDYGTGSYPGQLVLQDVLTLRGSQFRDAAVIVASPPCQAYSYRAMPWKRAKALPPPDNSLFEACFRIQLEACEAAGRYIPLVVENVRGAQPWVGRAKANFGSYYLWGDVGMVGRRVVAGVPRFGVSVQPTKAVKINGCSDPRRNGGKGAHLTSQLENDARKANPDSTDHGSGSWFKIANSKNRGANSEPTDGLKMGWDNSVRGKLRRDDSTKVPGISFNGASGQTSPGFNVTAAQRYREEAAKRVDESGVKGGGDWFGSGEDCSLQRRFSGTKQAGISGERNNGKGDRWFQDGAARHGSKSNSRKAASAQIAKIPFPLASYIARCFKPLTHMGKPELYQGEHSVR